MAEARKSPPRDATKNQKAEERKKPVTGR